NQALEIIRKRLETRHADMPMSTRIAEKIDQVLPLLRLFEKPAVFRDPAIRAKEYKNAFQLKERASDAMIDLMLQSQREIESLERVGDKVSASELRGASNAVTSLLDGALVEARYYLEKNQQDA
ncbi:hypothetical protein, partial [Nitrosomonas communis]|uniref:hypothetical protein n=1 Tax=Nitrosomonas communis TaxID=44574 RepID=UPI0026EBEE7C